MKYYLTLTILFFSFFVASGQCVTKEEQEHYPVSIEEAVIQLLKILPDTTQQNIFSMSEKEFTVDSHFGLGLCIRNNWIRGGGGELLNNFKSKGIFHPDDMSGIILQCYYRQLHNQDWELEKQIKYYQDYWKEQREYQYRLENDRAFARQEKKRYEASFHETFCKKSEELKKEFPVGTQIKVWVRYSDSPKQITRIIGEIVDWRVIVSKDNSFGITRKGPKFKIEHLEAKVRIIEFMDISKKEQVKSYKKIKNNELWVRTDSMKKAE